MKKIGFIGAGNMATALIKGIYDAQSDVEIFVYDKFKEKVDFLEKEYNIINTSFEKVISISHVIFLAVKPQNYVEVIKEMNSYLDSEKIIISIAPSYTIEKLEEIIKKDTKIVRAMPNTPALVKEGVTALSFNNKIEENEKRKIIQLISTVGSAYEVEEKLMNAVVGISGSAPAYAYIFIESLADAGVKHGMPRDLAYSFAAQTLLGSSKMVLETKEHPGKLKDNVTSPGGTTIEAVAALEEYGFRNSLIKAVDAAVKKCSDM